MPRLVVVGDHRRPLWVDFVHPRNERARAAIFAEIARAAPDLLLDTGDLVPGAFESSWRAFDRDIAPLREAGIAIEAVPGNHETYGVIPRSARAGARMSRFLARFPRAAGARWGSRDVGSTRILLLDSNARILSDDEQRAQEAFLEQAVAAADADARIGMVLAAWHHPPFTNSSKYGDDRFSARSFLPRLRRSRKLAAIFCGHIHGYERFYVDGVRILVTGGGGSHGHPFPRDHSVWRHTPEFDATALSHFHFVTAELDGTRATATTRHLDFSTGAPRWTDGDRFALAPRG